MIQAAQEASGDSSSFLQSLERAGAGLFGHWASPENRCFGPSPFKEPQCLLPLRRSARVLGGKSAHDRNQCGGFTVEARRGVTASLGDSTVFEGARALATACDFDPEGHSADPAKHDVRWW